VIPLTAVIFNVNGAFALTWSECAREPAELGLGLGAP
jgi:hypothetical protein